MRTLLSGWGLGLLVQKCGWDVGFMALVGMSLIGTLLFAAAWKANAHGYAEPLNEVTHPDSRM